MRLRVHHLIFAGSLGVVALLVTLTLLLVGSLLERELGRTLRAELGRELALAAGLVEAKGEIGADSLAREVAARNGRRVTILDTAGVVIGDSDVAPATLGTLESHRDRPEVAGALRAPGSTSAAERTSETTGEALVYVARTARMDGATVVVRIAGSRTDVRRAVARTRGAVAVAGLLASVAALGAAYLLSRMLARPLVALVARARRLARGDFSEPAPAHGVAELEEVGLALGHLAEQLHERLTELGTERDEMQVLIDCMAEGVLALDPAGRLLRINRVARGLLGLSSVEPGAPAGSFVRHPELREALEASLRGEEVTRELQLKGRHLLSVSRRLDRGGSVTTLLDITELRRLESVRRDFVANASHELKTPLTSIRGFAETLVEHEPPPAVRRRFFEAIRNNTLRMQRLVDDLLDLSRLEAGAWTMDADAVRVEEVAHESWALVGGRGGRSLEVRVDGAGVALADRGALGQVLRNLLENAVRHTEPDGRLEVRVRAGVEADTLVVEVVDDGEGIPARALPRVFERFYRADSARARDAGGTGLGLAIVKHLVGAMGGRVEAESELGRGTTVRFTLPAGRYRSVTER